MSNSKEYTDLPGMQLDGKPGTSIFSADNFYLGFVFDDPSLGIKRYDGTIIPRGEIPVSKDPAEYLAENVEPDRNNKNHIIYECALTLVKP